MSDTAKTTRWQSFAAIRAFATDAQIDRAATRWCGEKDRETFPEDIAYFKHNWWALPGLLARVKQEIASDAR